MGTHLRWEQLAQRRERVRRELALQHVADKDIEVTVVRFELREPNAQVVRSFAFNKLRPVIQLDFSHPVPAFPFPNRPPPLLHRRTPLLFPCRTLLLHLLSEEHLELLDIVIVQR